MPSWAIEASRFVCSFVSFAFVATTPMVVFPSGTRRDRDRRPATVSTNPPFSPRGPAMTSPVELSTMSPTALTTMSAPTTIAIAEALARGADATLEVAVGAHQLRDRSSRARTDTPFRNATALRASAPPHSRHRMPGRTSARPVLRSKITAPVTMGIRWRAKVIPMPCSSHQRTTPGIEAMPNRLPPVSTTACTACALYPGFRRSVS